MAEALRPAERGNIMAVEHLPRNVISTIEVNPKMLAEVQDPHLRRWLDPDFLAIHAALFARGFPEGDTVRPQPPIMHRGVVLRVIRTNEPYTDENLIQYGHIAIKGSGLTTTGTKHFNLSEKYTGGEYGDPLGFFGYYHSNQEMEVSDKFASRGGRNGRVIATLTLNHNQLRKWFHRDDKERKMAQIETAYPFDKMLNKVERNGDLAAICVRLMGADRTEDYRQASATDGLYTRQAMLTRAVYLLLSEIIQRGVHNFGKYYHIDGENLSLADTLNALTKLYHGDFVKDNLDHLVKLNHALHKHNAAVVKELSQKEYNHKLKADIRSENTDIAGFWYDWESTLPGKQYTGVTSIADSSHLLYMNASHLPLASKKP